MTQRTASTRFDLPQPFGPTTPVRPGSMAKSVGSTKDLKPIRRSRVSFILLLGPSPECPDSEVRTLYRHAPMRTSESKGTLAIYDSSTVFGFEVPMRASD